MPRNPIDALCSVVLLAMALPAPAAQPAGTSDTLLPATTEGFISVTNTKLLAERWKKTQFGRLLEDPVMQPFAEDLKEQFADQRSKLRRKLGLTLDDLKGIPSGELSVALIRPAEDQLAVVLLADVSGNEAEAEALLEKISGNLIDRGAKRTRTAVAGNQVLVFDLPKDEEEEPSKTPEEGQPRHAVFFLKDGLLGASDNLDVIKGVLARLGGNPGSTLAELPAYRAVMDRCRKDAGERTPQIRWFLDPFGYAKAIRAALPERDRRKGGKILDYLENVGFSAIQAAGGFVDLAAEGFEVVHRTAVYAPKPHEKSMKMLVFPNADMSAPPSWVPRDLAGYTTFSCDVLNAFDHFGPLFDQVIGEGVEPEEGEEEYSYWQDALDSVRDEELGPQMDIREELVAHLGRQLIVITDYEKPISTTSERLLFAVEASNAKAVARGIEKIFKHEENVRRREFEGHVIWETVPKEIPTVQPIKIDLPPLGIESLEEEDEEEGTPLLPNTSMTVANGYLLVASHYSFLISVLTPTDEREALGRAIDYLRIDGTIQDLGQGTHCLRAFSRTDEAYRPTYELIRRGKMPESQTMLGRVLNTILPSGEEGGFREQKIDGSKLPDFEFVRRHLGPAGLFGTSEVDGWFLKGFILSKEAE